MVVALAACTTGAATASAPAATVTTGASPTTPATPTSEPTPTPISGLFDVGGHRLWMECTGEGTPTVVYFHGYIYDAAGGGSQNAGRIPSLLSDRVRVCRYDRTNVGKSDPVPGPITGADEVRDLHALLSAANVPGPYVLLGASYGGMLADMYAATYPTDVVGIVFLDAILPGQFDVEKTFIAEEYYPGADDWMGTQEQLDQLTTETQAKALTGKEPSVPVTYLAAAQGEELPPGTDVSAFVNAVRDYQQEFIARFPNSKFLTVEASHFMEPEIPEQIADEVRALFSIVQGDA